jgi:hypothetical protein
VRRYIVIAPSLLVRIGIRLFGWLVRPHTVVRSLDELSAGPS